MQRAELIEQLKNGRFDERLRAISGGQPLALLIARLVSVIEGFCKAFPNGDTRELRLYSAPGRTELLGNHTDHQGGCVLAAAADVDTLCCAAENGENTARVFSQGHRPIEIALSSLDARAEERGRSPSLVRGMAAQLNTLDITPVGFDAYTETQVLRGSGLSSSAAFEVLLGTVMCDFADATLPAQTIAALGQRAENEYYGKPCGLMDQMACAVGGVVGIDFANAPAVRRCVFDWERTGYALVILDSGANHAALDEEYAAIPREMCAVARMLGGTRLCEVREENFFAERADIERRCGKRAADRAAHYFVETRRAREGFAALQRGDFAAFLSLVRASAESSETLLQNVALDRPDGDRLLRVIQRARALAGEDGAARVHGGGFAGTAQAWVKRERLDDFLTQMGASRCRVLHTRPLGAWKLAGE